VTDAARTDLATRFAESGSDVIEVDGQEVQPIVTLDVGPGDILEITRLTANRQRPQALRLAVKTGELIVSSTTASEVALWTTTAPRKARVRIDASEPTSLDVWNAWRFGGLEHAWIGNAGMVIHSDRGRYTLQCSDGIGPVDFTDLVVTVQILRP
jgi:hypothetical protein